MDNDTEIISVGIDLVDIRRLAEALQNGSSSFRAHVFTAMEWADCGRLPNSTEALAIRFAAKEACLKALRTGWAQRATLTQVTSTTSERRLSITLTGAALQHAEELGVRSIVGSFAVAGNTAMVMVVLTR